MSAEAPGAQVRTVTRWRGAFRAWRWQRPFWAGLLTLLGGLPIIYFPYANLTMGQLTIRMSTTAGSGSLIIGVLLVVLGLTMWFQSAVRVFAGVATILLGLVSLVVSNFGGFLVGFLLALFGGGLAVSWVPGVAENGQPAKGAGAGPKDSEDGRDGADGRDGRDRPDGGSETPEPEPAGAGWALDQESTHGRHRAG
jgi:hypothetical protein